MNDVTFTMDQIRAVAFKMLLDFDFLEQAEYARFAQGVVSLTARLSELAGEDVKDSCLDKSKGAGK